ncbi:DsbA family protein [Cellulomonas sp. Marseille-Q8402]
MTSPTPNPGKGARPSKNERRDAAREQARVLREQQAKRDRRNKFIAIGGLSAAVITLIVVAAIIIVPSLGPGIAYTGDDAESLALADVTAPATAEDDGAIPVGQDGVAGVPAAEDDVVVSVYYDYMCPYCGMFEAANDTELAQLREEGGVTVEYHPISFLDGQSAGGEYSTRAGNAAAVVADQDPDSFAAFSSALFANQPEEGTKGLSDDEIADIATEVGVPSDVVDAFTATADDAEWRTFAPWLVATTNQANTDLNGLSTPTVLIDGEKFEGDLYTAGPLTEAVEAAKG